MSVRVSIVVQSKHRRSSMEGRLVRPWDSPLVLDYWWTLDIPVYYAEAVVKCCYWLRRVDPCGFVRVEAMAAMWCRSEILNFLL